MSDYDSIVCTEGDDAIVTITLNRPERLNAFNAVMAEELVDAFDCADRTDSVRAVIVTSAGEGLAPAPIFPAVPARSISPPARRRSRWSVRCCGAA